MQDAVRRTDTSNDSSGVLSEKVNSGISMQGNVYIRDGELRFLAGGVYETARYDLKTLKCLNTPFTGVTSQFRTAFYPYYPDYGKYVSLDHDFDDGKSLSHDASYEGSRFTNLAFLGPLPPGVPKPVKLASRWGRRTGKPVKRDTVWQDKVGRRFTSFVVGPNALLAAGHSGNDDARPFLAAIDLDSGGDLWSKTLPATVVKGGTAIDHRGRIVVALENGEVACFRLVGQSHE